MFKIIKKDKTSEARLGILTTPHGVIKTPAYVIVATRGEIKTLKSSDIKRTKTQVVISNTYHLWDWALQRASLQSKDALCKHLGLKIPTMTDSGGFQVFSLAFGKHAKAGKIFPKKDLEKKDKNTNIERKNVRITNKGVYFRPQSHDIAKHNFEKWQFLGPELSIKLQQKIGADIIFAFDECTSFFDNFKYNKKAMERTHAWAKKCLETHSKISHLHPRYTKASAAVGSTKSAFDQTKSANEQNFGEPKQMLFGIVQGGRYKSLRIKSSKFVGSLPFDGFGIGGSFGKEEMVKMLKWVIPNLPEEKPRHLLGIGRVEDIFQAIENGVDLFDCVIPTREARHGRIWTAKDHYDIRKTKFSQDKNPLEKRCGCPTCHTTTKAKVHEFFKSPNKLERGMRLATIHNIYFFNNLVEKIRESILKNKYREFKNKFFL